MIEIGDYVRIMRVGYLGRAGYVEDLTAEPGSSPTAVLDLEGETVTVPVGMIQKTYEHA